MNYRSLLKENILGTGSFDLPNYGQRVTYSVMHEQRTQNQQPRMMTNEEAEGAIPLAHAMVAAERSFLHLEAEELEKYRGRVLAFGPDGRIIGDAKDYDGAFRLIEESGENLGLCPIWLVDDTPRV